MGLSSIYGGRVLSGDGSQMTAGGGARGRYEIRACAREATAMGAGKYGLSLGGTAYIPCHIYEGRAFAGERDDGIGGGRGEGRRC